MMEGIEDTLAALRIQRQQAIAEYQFKKAKEIEDQINALKSTNAEDKRRQKISNQKHEFETEKTMLKSKAISKRGKYTNKLLALRQVYQRRLVDLNNKHALEMSDLAATYGKGLELATSRSVPESNELLRISKLKADMSEYELAETLHNEGVALAEETTEMRKEEVHQAYQVKQDELIAKQQKEIDDHQAKLENEIDLLVMTYDRKINKLKQAYQLHAIKYRITLQPNEIESFFSEYSLIDDEGGSRVLESPTKRAPTKPSTPVKSPRSPKSPYTHKPVGRSPSKPMWDSSAKIGQSPRSPRYKRSPMK